MAGRIHGFLGGVLLTGSLAYLTSREFRINQGIVSQSLRESSRIIEERNLPVPHQSNVLQYQDKTVSESIKDIWNHEVIKSVNYLYSLDFASVGESITKKIDQPAEKGADQAQKDLSKPPFTRIESKTKGSNHPTNEIRKDIEFSFLQRLEHDTSALVGRDCRGWPFYLGCKGRFGQHFLSVSFGLEISRENSMDLDSVW
ncbi:hypothetical protein OGAPHI_004881 [Ogataea philodendri]|uniref:MICOS complex subunit MIC12 n=1 Tax=Ogataea philodendri TaxID=1378263 RepID=A0A9P8P3H5_9ASCO|nr:uncharacterized protein OGAPHI_004881 [Ogataea philodendri]KAH3664167.1 hypothetical protein OGAPHI_004881 [Ogataea philodendri]